MTPRFRLGRAFAVLLALILITAFWQAGRIGANERTQGFQPSARFSTAPSDPIIGTPAEANSSAPLSELAPTLTLEDQGLTLAREINPRHDPLRFAPDVPSTGFKGLSAEIAIDPLIALNDSAARSPEPETAFTGSTGCSNCTPPDTTGAAGPDHYVSMVNSHLSVYDKAGTLLLGAIPFSSVFDGAGGQCETQNAGDPVVLYDRSADRWLIAQMARVNQLCVAVSQTADPTQAYFTYEFDTGQFPDYFKIGTWHDGYYVAASETNYTAYAFERSEMLTGDTAQFVKFSGQSNLLLPADQDSMIPADADQPGLFYTFKDNVFHGGTDRLELFELDVDWATPENSTFALVQSFDLASFVYTPCGYFNFSCVSQLGTTRKVDTIAEWPMFRFPYQQVGASEMLVGAFTVGGGAGEAGAAVRWFQLKRTAGADWELVQEGTQDAQDGHDRFNGSIAIDQNGHIALGYTVSSSSMYPDIRYAMRKADDPAGVMREEVTLATGEASQTTSSRWGDYSTMALDPTDQCTFWYTNQTIGSNGRWKTHVGSFRDPDCGPQSYTFELDKTADAICLDDGSSTFAITVNPEKGFDHPISWTIQGLPLGAFGLFTPSANSPAQEVVLILVNLPVGTHNLTLKGSGGGLTREQQLSVKVGASAPETPALAVPDAWMVGDPAELVLSWSPAANAATYRVEFSETDDFTTILKTIDDLDFNLFSGDAGLDLNQKLFWRVTAMNGCGESAPSAPQGLITAPDIDQAIIDAREAELTLPDVTTGEVRGRFVFTNRSAGADVFTISAEVPEGWTLIFDQGPQFPLLVGESIEIGFTLIPPLGASFGASVPITLTVESAQLPNQPQVVVLDTAVPWPQAALFPMMTNLGR